MTNARRVLALAVATLLGSTPAIAAAHPAGSFDACLTRADVEQNLLGSHFVSLRVS
jgi:hypothetical protein